MTPSKRPNILFLMSDEHRADVTGYEGNPVIRTPVLDELAETGVIFRNAYTPSPICIPGRQAMMTGQLPRTCHCELYGQDIAPFSMTFAHRLAQYGYESVVAGKLHHMGPDQMQGWTVRVAGDMHVARPFIDGLNRDAEVSVPLGKWSDAKEIQRAGVGNSPVVRSDTHTVQGAINFIESYFSSPYYDRPSAERPLLLKVSLVQPHYPYQTSEEKFSYYLNRVQPYLDPEVFPHPFLSQRRVVPGVDVNERELRRATAAYYGMVETIDDMYGQVLDALRHHGQDLDEWIILYTTDHGEMLGQHGIWEKQKFFEASVRVPLFIRWPRGFAGGRQVEENVNLCDLFATLCDLCSVPVPDGLDSRSLAPLLASQPVKWNNESISQFSGNNLMIKRDALKYQYYGKNGPEVLFDLECDPGETTNFAEDPAYAEPMASFRQRCAELGFGPNADPHYSNAGYSYIGGVY